MRSLGEDSLGSRFQNIERRINELEVKLAEGIRIHEAHNDRKMNQLEEHIDFKLDAIFKLLNAHLGKRVPDE